MGIIEGNGPDRRDNGQCYEQDHLRNGQGRGQRPWEWRGSSMQPTRPGSGERSDKPQEDTGTPGPDGFTWDPDVKIPEE